MRGRYRAGLSFLFLYPVPLLFHVDSHSYVLVHYQNVTLHRTSFALLKLKSCLEQHPITTTLIGRAQGPDKARRV